ncbi:PspC domain-containing protein [Nocardioides sp. YIM 152588]|uniref:PspC domain-containing protein n=1 Tax=Nocardioides sp. YIM 152588 TaxID=3158259 RepID=UPI0032E4D46A
MSNPYSEPQPNESTTHEPGAYPGPSYQAPPPGRGKRLTRSRTDKMLGGVCGGVAAYLDVDATIVRLLMVAAIIFTGGAALLLYIAGWLLMPYE